MPRRRYAPTPHCPTGWAYMLGYFVRSVPIGQAMIQPLAGGWQLVIQVGDDGRPRTHKPRWYRELDTAIREALRIGEGPSASADGAGRSSGRAARGRRTPRSNDRPPG